MALNPLRTLKMTLSPMITQINVNFLIFYNYVRNIYKLYLYLIDKNIIHKYNLTHF